MLMNYDVKNKRFITFYTHKVILRPTINDLQETIIYLVVNCCSHIVPDIVRDFDNYNKRLLKLEKAFKKENKNLVETLETSRTNIKELEAKEQVLLDNFIKSYISRTP